MMAFGSIQTDALPQYYLWMTLKLLKKMLTKALYSLKVRKAVNMTAFKVSSDYKSFKWIKSLQESNSDTHIFQWTHHESHGINDRKRLLQRVTFDTRVHMFNGWITIHISSHNIKETVPTTTMYKAFTQVRTTPDHPIYSIIIFSS